MVPLRSSLAALSLCLTAQGCAATVCPGPDPALLAAAVLDELEAREARAADAFVDEPGPAVAEPEFDAGDDEFDEQAARIRVPIEGHPGFGASAPLVTIVSFSDFQCPFCSRVVPTLDQLLDAYEGDVRIVFYELPLPFHDHAKLAAEAALEAYAQRGDAGYVAMRAALYEHQRALDRASIEGYAGAIGLDLRRFRAALDDHRHLRTVEADMALADRVGATGTPSFFVNGRPLVGAQPYDAFAALVANERAAAQALIATGVPRAEVYTQLMAAAVDAPAPTPDEDPPARVDRPDAEATYALEIPTGTPGRGARQPLVTIVAFTDYECPFCARADVTMRTLLERYPDTLRIVYLQNPLSFHPHALEAAMAAREAYAQRGDAGYFAMHDALLRAYEDDDLSRERIEAIAVSLQLDVPRLRRALDDGTHRARVVADQALAARFGARGTPTFFVNGRYLPGAQPLEAFVAKVDEELAEARALVESGVRRRDVYARVIRDGVPRFEAE